MIYNQPLKIYMTRCSTMRLEEILIFCVLQKYRYQDEDTPPQEHISPQITNEVIGPELVHVSEKNLSEIENVHGFVFHSHISPVKVR